MKNRILIVLAFVSILLLTIQKVNAQVTSSGQNSYVSLSSYQGVTLNRAYGFMLHIRGYETKYEGWSLAVRANPDIINDEGKVMDPAKISLRMNTIEGERFPTMAQIGANKTPIPLDYSNRFFIQNSPYAIQQINGKDYAQWSFFFDLIIAGGAYLEKLQSYKEYILNTTFLVLDKNNQVVTQITIPIRMMIYPQGVPPSEPTYGIQVNSSARNGLLELKTMRDYIEGVSQTYKDGLSVTSTTNYSIEVRSLKNNFEAGNNTLPVNAVSLELKDSRNNGGGTIVLSESTQTVFNTTATGKQARLFDIRYFTTPNDERLINATPASYQTTLMYTLVPQ